MGNNVQRVLFVNSEMTPYLPEDKVASVGRSLPQGIQEKKKDIRCFMPRYGCINERKHQLHEVIRLSGMNIIINEVDHPLIIKVASISSARIQVYFIDNEDYFKRKFTVRDDKGAFFADNDERAIFFARGVLETVKKLRWAPDVIHCQGWMSHLIPLYLKKVYKDDPIFAGCKVVLSLYNEIEGEKFAPNFAHKALVGSIKENDVNIPEGGADGINLAKTAIKYSDGIILADKKINPDIVAACKESGLPLITSTDKALAEGSYVDEYCDFYEKL